MTAGARAADQRKGEGTAHASRPVRPRLAALPLLLLFAVALGGCTAPDDLSRFVDRATGKVRYAEVQRLGEDLTFTASDTAGPGGFGKQADYNFTVLLGATKLHVEVSVAFTPGPVALPQGVPQGNVTVAVGSAGGSRLLAFSETGVQAFDEDKPAPGPRAVHVTAVGQGRVHLLALSTEPVP